VSLDSIGRENRRFLALLSERLKEQEVEAGLSFSTASTQDLANAIKGFASFGKTSFPRRIKTPASGGDHEVPLLGGVPKRPIPLGGQMSKLGDSDKGDFAMTDWSQYLVNDMPCSHIDDIPYFPKERDIEREWMQFWAHVTKPIVGADSACRKALAKYLVDDMPYPGMNEQPKATYPEKHTYPLKHKYPEKQRVCASGDVPKCTATATTSLGMWGAAKAWEDANNPDSNT